ATFLFFTVGLGIYRLAGGEGAALGYVFCTLVAFRYVLFFFEMLRLKVNWRDIIVDYWLYLFAGPYFLIVPYMVVIPTFTAFRQSQTAG
ncbi:hypothetical protein DF186_17940, partial [Enterococcus hirae]